MKIRDATKKGYTEIHRGGVFDISFPDSKTRRGRVQDYGNTSPTIMTGSQIAYLEMETNITRRIRRLTERECFRLMGVKDSDTDKIQAAGISSTQQYKMAGNSIVVDVLAGIFTNLIKGCEKPEDYLF